MGEERERGNSLTSLMGTGEKKCKIMRNRKEIRGIKRDKEE